MQQHRIELRQLTEAEGGGWLATFPDLPGCMSDGETPEEAMQNARQAEISWIRATEKWATKNIKSDENNRYEYWQRNEDQVTKIADF